MSRTRLFLHALVLNGLQARDRPAHFAVLVGLRALTRGGLHAQIELLAAQLQQLFAELCFRFARSSF